MAAVARTTSVLLVAVVAAVVVVVVLLLLPDLQKWSMSGCAQPACCSCRWCDPTQA
jgi:hypothetical protein